MEKSSDRKMALALGIINCFINEDTSVLAITSPFKTVQSVRVTVVFGEDLKFLSMLDT